MGLIESSEDIQAWNKLIKVLNMQADTQAGILTALNNIMDRLDNITGAIQGEK